ncbi:MAG: hypothetical protein RLY70_568 [Planctomycetota bacterium]|jgi:HEAT repeats
MRVVERAGRRPSVPRFLDPGINDLERLSGVCYGPTKPGVAASMAGSAVAELYQLTGESRDVTRRLHDARRTWRQSAAAVRAPSWLRGYAVLAAILSNVLGLGLFTGCAEGPFGLARYNPVLVEEWRKDEKFGPTLHQRLEEMREWEQQARSMDTQEELMVCAKLSDLIRSDSNTLLVTQAVKTLGAIDSAQSLEAIRFASTHPQPDVRVAACRAWGMKKTAESSEMLANFLNSDTHLDVRLAAARELRAFPGEATIQTLAVALEDPDPALQRRCAESLEAVTGRNLGSDVKAWREYIASGQARPAEPVSIADRFYSLFR